MKPFLLAALAALTLAGCTPKATAPEVSQVQVVRLQNGATGCDEWCDIRVTNTGGTIYGVVVHASVCSGASLDALSFGDMAPGQVKTGRMLGHASSTSCLPGMLVICNDWVFTVTHS